jgi:lipopolysaccharide transport system permease protein
MGETVAPKRIIPTVVIEPFDSWWRLDVRFLWTYRELLLFLVWRDVKARYAQSALGVGWAVIQPVSSMVVFSVIFGRVAAIETGPIPYPLFSYLGVVPWAYFSGTLQDSTQSLVRNSNMLQKIYFPRLFLPLSAILAKLLDFLIASVLLIPLMAFYQMKPAWSIFWVPVLVLIMAIAVAGLGTFLTALAIQYRDIQHAMGFSIQLLMYAAPVAYPVTYVPERFQLIYALNPMVGVIEGLRSAVLGLTPMPWDLIGVSATSALVLAVVGVLYFQSRARIFADVG